MEFFTKSKAVRLKSHLNKYLVADDDQVSTRQSRRGTAREARWLVELVDNNRGVVRLKSCHHRYLTASNIPFLLIRDGFQVKLQSHDGAFLRANGGTPPWRNSVTHDRPHAAVTRDWVVWDVEEVGVSEDEIMADYLSMISSCSSVSGELSGSDFEFRSSLSVQSSCSVSASTSPSWHLTKTPLISTPRRKAMELFLNAKIVRLKSCHDKYLTADEDEESVVQDRDGSSKAAKWTVEFVENSNEIIRLKSCYGKYLTASNQPFLLGMTGRKVLQTRPTRLDSSVEWEPLMDRGGAVKMQTRHGQFMRANGGVPPWRNSVTHDIPHRTATKEWILWEVHVVDIHIAKSPAPPLVMEKKHSFTPAVESPPAGYSSKSNSFSFSRQQSNDTRMSSPPEGRLIYFHIADENGRVDEGFEEMSITFKGNNVNELTRRLEEELGIDRISVCATSPLNGKLYPLRLQLPPNNATMHVVVVPPSP